MADNKLFYGDNLDVLRRYVKDETVDLIYVDPPFNSRQDYNVLFAEKDGTQSSSQITAFEDTWEWNLDAERAYQEIVERGGTVSQATGLWKIVWDDYPAAIKCCLGESEDGPNPSPLYRHARPKVVTGREGHRPQSLRASPAPGTGRPHSGSQGPGRQDRAAF